VLKCDDKEELVNVKAIDVAQNSNAELCASC